jgi:cyclase
MRLMFRSSPVAAQGNVDHIYEALTEGRAEAALVASIVHYGTYTIRQIKEELRTRGVDVRI